MDRKSADEPNPDDLEYGAPRAPGRPGPKPSPQRRAAIIAAAAKLFAERGIQTATTREIAALAGVTERTLFKHFGTKGSLVEAVLDELSIRTMKAMAFSRILDPTPLSAGEFMAWHRAFLTERVAGAELEPNHYRLMFRELLQDSDLSAAYAATWREQILRPLTAHLAQMQAQGEANTTVGPGALAAGFYSLNLSYLLARFALLAPASWSNADDIDTVVKMFAAMCGWDADAGLRSK